MSGNGQQGVDPVINDHPHASETCTKRAFPLEITR